MNSRIAFYLVLFRDVTIPENHPPHGIDCLQSALPLPLMKNICVSHDGTGTRLCAFVSDTRASGTLCLIKSLFTMCEKSGAVGNLAGLSAYKKLRSPRLHGQTRSRH